MRSNGDAGPGQRLACQVSILPVPDHRTAGFLRCVANGKGRRPLRSTCLVLIQIPCLNEAGTMGDVVRGLLELRCDGVEFQLLLIDDGSSDGTADVALALGVHHVARHRHNRGLAAAFATGLDACLRLGADVIVNTDGDGQYGASDIPQLLEPILAGRADLVIGDRRPGDDRRQSWLRRRLQTLGSRVTSFLARQPIPDAVSGFRAMTRDAAMKIHIVTGFSYTIESLLQAANCGMAIKFVPITTNTVTRPSRLYRSVPQFVLQSAVTMLRVFFMFRPMAVLATMGAICGAVGAVPIIRFLALWAQGHGSGHVQSLVLGGVFVVLSALMLIAALFADLIARNRRLLEMTLEKVQRMELPVGEAPVEAGSSPDRDDEP